MNTYRRNTFHDWFVDVGYIYLIVIAIVCLIYFFQTAELSMPTPIKTSTSADLFRAGELPSTP